MRFSGRRSSWSVLPRWRLSGNLAASAGSSQQGSLFGPSGLTTATDRCLDWLFLQDKSARTEHKGCSGVNSEENSSSPRLVQMAEVFCLL